YQRGRLSWSINGYMNRLLTRSFQHFSEAFQWYFFYGDYLAGYPIGDDLLKASMISLNALGEIMATPEPGSFCTTDATPNTRVLRSSSTTCTGTAMNIPLGIGKNFYVEFDGNYYWHFTSAGSLYEKLAAMIALTSTEANFFMADTFAESDRYSI